MISRIHNSSSRPTVIYTYKYSDLISATEVNISSTTISRTVNFFLYNIGYRLIETTTRQIRQRRAHSLLIIIIRFYFVPGQSDVSCDLCDFNARLTFGPNMRAHARHISISLPTSYQYYTRQMIQKHRCAN